MQHSLWSGVTLQILLAEVGEWDYWWLRACL